MRLWLYFVARGRSTGTASTSRNGPRRGVLRGFKAIPRVTSVLTEFADEAGVVGLVVESVQLVKVGVFSPLKLTSGRSVTPGDGQSARLILARTPTAQVLIPVHHEPFLRAAMARDAKHVTA